MPVVIRLARKGHSHSPFYRITVADSRVAATGKFLDQIGHFDPKQNPPVVKIDAASAIKWLHQGAQPSDTVRAILHREGIMEKASNLAHGKAPETAPLKPRSIARKKTKVHKKAKAAAAAAKPAEAPAAPAA